MTTAINDEELRRAACSLERLQAFFEARAHATIRDESAEALERLHLALVNAIEQGLKPVMLGNEIPPPPIPSRQSVEQRPGRCLDIGRLGKFAGFVDQLGDWYLAHASSAASDQGKRLLVGQFVALGATNLAVETILKNSNIRSARAQSAVAGPVRENPSRDAVLPQEAEAPAEPVDTRLVLQDTAERHLLQTFKGCTELTPDARDELHAFLRAVGIEYQGAQMGKFERRVEQWIENTPPYHVLVLGISVLSGRRKPYAKYVMRDNLDD